MNITQATYGNPDHSVVRAVYGDGTIAALMANSPELDGVAISPYVAPSYEPPPLTARQLRLGLIGAGVTLTSVTAAIEALNDPAALVEWEYATVYERNHPLVVQIGTTLGLTANQVDTLWAQAFTL